MAQRVFGFGSNLFSNCSPTTSDLSILDPELLHDVTRIEAASFSQTVLVKNGTRVVIGLPLAGELPEGTPLGQETFVAVLQPDGRLFALEEERASQRKFSLVEINEHDEVLAVGEDRTSVHFFRTLKEAISSSSNPTPLPFSVPLSEPILKIVSGSSHFLLLTSHSVFSFGDNRFTQCGIPSSSAPSPTVNLIEFFEGLQPVEIAAGDLHSVVLTRDGSAYVFGADMKGQLGGTGGGEPALVDLLEEGTEGEEEPEIVQVACGSGSTVLLSKEGEVWVAGLSEFIPSLILHQWFIC